MLKGPWFIHISLQLFRADVLNLGFSHLLHFNPLSLELNGGDENVNSASLRDLFHLAGG